MADLMLDSTVFRDHQSGDPGARALVERIIDGSVTAAASPVTLFELWRAPDLDRQAEIGYVGILSFLEEAPLSVEAAKIAGIWLASVDEDERPGLTTVALIAASAHERKESIATSNPGPFNRFDSETIGY